jgi:cysteine synthase A
MSSLPAFDANFEWVDPAPAALPELWGKYRALRSFYERLGNTDLREIPGDRGGARILAKLEWQNPVRSVKDRVAYALLCDALVKHNDRPLDQLRIVEYSGGNLANSLSYLCSELGISTHFVLSSAAPTSLLTLLQERRAEVELVDKELGFYAVVQRALGFASQKPDWTLLYQHRNTANVAAHTTTTGVEIVEQIGNVKPAAWVASIGTGGTLIGVARTLVARFPSIRIVGVTPAELPYGSHEPPNGLAKYAGSGGMGYGVRQPFVHAYKGAVEHHTVSFAEAMKAMVEFLRLTDIRIGSSAAANWIAAREIARELPSDATVVTVFPDAGTPEEWVKAHSMASN